MFKITHYDWNCCPICDGVACFFTDDLEDYEKNRFSKKSVSEEFKEKYFRSKNGEIVVDYYSDDPELNIVIEDKSACILSQKQYLYEQTTFELLNFYDWPSEVYAEKAVIDLYNIKFKGTHYLAGKYYLGGVCRPAVFSDIPDAYQSISVYGNPILKIYHTPIKYTKNPETGLFDILRPKEAFAEDTVETFCYKILKKYDSDKFDNTLPDALDEELIQQLMNDIPGEAG